MAKVSPEMAAARAGLETAQVEHVRARSAELRGRAKEKRQRGAAARTRGQAHVDAADISARQQVRTANSNAAAQAAKDHAGELEAARQVAAARRKGEDEQAAGERAGTVRETKRMTAERQKLDEARRTSTSHRLAEAEQHEVAKMPHVRRQREKELKDLAAKNGKAYRASAFLTKVFSGVRKNGSNPQQGKTLGNPYMLGR